MTIKEIKARIAFLENEIAAYPYWGAALAAMDEERGELQSTLEALQSTPENKETD